MRHVAPLLFSDVGQTALCDRVSATAPSTLPQFLWVTPNMCNDDHDCPPASGDTWLAAHVPAWLAQGAEVFITYDTGDPDQTHGGGHVYAVLVGKGIAPATNGTLMDHYSALAGVENAFGLPLLGEAKGAKPVPF
jgi:acid phosphatase